MSRIRQVALLVTFCIPCVILSEAKDLGSFVAKNTPQDDTLNYLRLNTDDLSLPRSFELPHTIDAVENLFKKPLAVPATSKDWLTQLETSTSSVGLLDIASVILRSGSDEGSGTLRSPKRAQDDKSVDSIVRNLAAGVARAQPLLNEAVDSVKGDDRRAFLQTMDWPDEKTGLIQQDISAKGIKRKFDAMNTFRQESLLSAAAIVMEAADQAIMSLQKLEIASATQRPRNDIKRVATANGIFLIGGPGDNVYTKDDLKNVVLLIDLGGVNTYEGPVSAARDKEIRLAIDMGKAIYVRHDINSTASLAAGIFGIGLFYAPNAENVNMTSGAFSQGCGLGGVGGLFLNGEARLSADRVVQGAAAFGVGILDVKNGAGSMYEANRSGQGVGFTRGVGFFRHEGDKAKIHGGLVQPDPREPLGTVSLCQGVGFGRRAYTGGGVGIASVTGDDIQVLGSYFAQGCGYWHALGIFHLRGNRSTLQARRYSLGSGVHSAFGHLEIDGDENRVLNWGVGPAYGWDRGLGSFRLHGDRNEIQAEWGTGVAAIGSLSFSDIRGNENRLKLPDFGSGGFFNDEFAYSFHNIDGEENRLESPIASPEGVVYQMRNPWGVAHLSGVRFETNLGLEKPVWPQWPRETARERERVDLQGILRAAEQKPQIERSADLVDVSSAFSLDQETPRRALEQLLQSPDDAVAGFVDILEPAAVEQMIRLRIVIAAFGSISSKAILTSYSQATVQKKIVLLSLLGRLNPAESLPFLLKEAFEDQQNDRLRISAARSLGFILNKDTGQEPGFRAASRAIESFLKNTRREEKMTIALLSRLRLSDAFGVLSTAVPLDGESRMAFLKTGPKDITETIGVPAAREMLRQLTIHRATATARLQNTLTHMSVHEEKIREGLFRLLHSTIPLQTSVAITVLGQLGKEEDAVRIAPFLAHTKAPVREAAAVALGRLGDGGLKVLENVFVSTPSARRLVMAAIPHSLSHRADELLFQGLRDADSSVRLQALAVFGALPAVLENDRARLIKRAQKILREETDASVRLGMLSLN